MCPNKVFCTSGKPVLCQDGRCVSSVEDCNPTRICPYSQPYRCPDNSCAQSRDSCPTQISCSKGYPIKCQDASCVTSKALCPSTGLECEAGHFKCPSGACAKSYSLCPATQTCPVGEVKCWDGSCRAVSAGSTKDQTCPPPATNLMCTSIERPIRCSNGKCVAALKDCPTEIICPREKPIRCSDSSCAASKAECTNPFSCEEGKRTCPDGSCSSSICGSALTCTGTHPYKCWDQTCVLRAKNDLGLLSMLSTHAPSSFLSLSLSLSLSLTHPPPPPTPQGINQYNFAAVLTTTGSGRPFCGSVVVSPTQVLTAAHCVQGDESNPTALSVCAG